MPGVTADEISRAKQIDLLSYLQAREPGELRRTSPHEYRTVSHDSLVISNGIWHWCSRGIGGRSALDFLVRVRDMKFVDAVRLLNDERAPPSFFQPVKAAKPPPVPFALPETSRFATHVIAYLQKRGIDPAIIGECLERGILCESRQYQNCVFVGKNLAGKPLSATLRGTVGSFKGDAPGSDKRFGFALDGGAAHLLLAFESPIDALSRATLDRWTNAPERHYLSLGGTAPLALVQYLTDHPQITSVLLCLDNDRAGLDGIDKITAVLQESAAFSHVKICAQPPPKECGKDYNELLLAQLTTRTAQVKRNFER